MCSTVYQPPRNSGSGRRTATKARHAARRWGQDYSARTHFGAGGRDDTIRRVPSDLIAEMYQQRARNDDRVVALVRENSGVFSVAAAALRLLLADNTVPNAVRRDVVSLWDGRLFSK